MQYQILTNYVTVLTKMTMKCIENIIYSIYSVSIRTGKNKIGYLLFNVLSMSPHRTFSEVTLDKIGH